MASFLAIASIFIDNKTFVRYNGIMENYSEFKKCCFSGYRPSKFPFKLENGSIDYEVFLKKLKTTISALIDDDCTAFYTGMAMGFDIIAAEAVLEFKKHNSEIKLIAAVPFNEQEENFPINWKKRYRNVINACDEIVVLSDNYYSGCYQNRNKYMVDNSDYIVTWYDGLSGGTRSTLTYAQKKNHYIININTEYLKEFNNLQTKLEI